MKKILFVAAAWFFCVLSTLFIQSCHDDCGFDGPMYQHLASANAKANRVTGTEVHNNIPYYILAPLDSNVIKIRYDSLVIQMEHTFTSFTAPVPGLFDFNKALACSPVINYSKVSGIKITSNQNYNSWLPKGSNLADVTELHVRKTVNGLKVSEVSSNTIPYVEPENWYFTFIKAPDHEVIHDLLITYNLDNGREITALLKNVMITK